MSGYFTTDRARKYGWGVPRLTLLTLFAFEVVPRRFLAASAPDAAAASLALAPYLASMRWLGHAYMGSIGAGVNVQVLGFLGNLAMLLLAAAACVWDVSHDYSILVYLVKTFSGDQLAGKLDTPEWKLVLLFTFGLFGPGLWLAAGSNAAALDAARPYLRVLPVLFLIQAVCEFGDAHLEHHPLVGKFFRHRYGFEAFTLAALTCMPGGITPPSSASCSTTSSSASSTASATCASSCTRTVSSPPPSPPSPPPLASCVFASSARCPVEDWSTSPTRRSPRRCSARRTSKATR